MTQPTNFTDQFNELMSVADWGINKTAEVLDCSRVHVKRWSEGTDTPKQPQTILSALGDAVGMAILDKDLERTELKTPKEDNGE